MDIDAAFILKFIIIGFKVTDLGNIVRIADDSIIKSMITLPDAEIELLRNLIKSGTGIDMHEFIYFLTWYSKRLRFNPVKVCDQMSSGYCFLRIFPLMKSMQQHLDQLESWNL